MDARLGLCKTRYFCISDGSSVRPFRLVFDRNNIKLRLVNDNFGKERAVNSLTRRKISS